MKIIILGIGNLLMGDEGIGVQCIQTLDLQHIPPEIQVIDGGTGGFHLLELFRKDCILIMVDATMDEKEAGSVSLLRPKFSSEFPRTLSAHDIGLRDLVESAALTDSMPSEIYLITISIKQFQSMTMELSQPIASSIPHVHKMIYELVKKLTI